MSIKRTLTVSLSTFSIIAIVLGGVYTDPSQASSIFAGFGPFRDPTGIVELNSTSNDNGPSLSPDGLAMYFSSNRPGGQGDGDLWVVRRANVFTSWGTPHNLGPTINTDSNENQPSLSSNGLTMIFNSNRPGGFGSADIYVSSRSDVNNDLGWSAPINRGPTINTEWAEIGPYYDQAGEGGGYYFVSDRPGGLGGLDIYFAAQPKVEILPPVNLTRLNGEGNENGPFVSRDGKEIVFSSTRNDSDGMDIYSATRSDRLSSWNAPLNMRVVNSGDFEIDPILSTDGSTIHFLSSRGKTLDLFRATRPPVNRGTGGDLDGDGRTDLTVYRPSEGRWYTFRSSGGVEVLTWGLADDKIVPRDYDGDGRTDIGVWRPSNGNWYVINSSTGTFSAQQWGQTGDIPIPNDYDGDGMADKAVFREGAWWVSGTTAGVSLTNWGTAGDVPLGGQF